MSDMQETLQEVEKALSTPTYIQGPILVRENLDGFINRLAYKDTPLRDRLPRKPGSGLAASWNVLTGIGVGNSTFAEGGTPTEDATTYVRRSAQYKELGKVKSITDKMMAAGKNFADQDAEQLDVAMREVVQDEEQLIVTGDSGAEVLEFDGLATSITNIINDNNNALGFRTDLLDQAIEAIAEAYSIRATVIAVGFGMKRAINQSLAGDVRINLDQTNEVSTGVEVGMYQSMVGKIPFLATFAIASDTTTYPGYTVQDIYVLTEKGQGGDILYMEDLYGMGRTYLDRTGAAVKFMVTECTVLVNRAPEFHRIISNVRIA